MKKFLVFCVAVGFVLALGNPAMAEKWKVPGDFRTIQEAIDSDNVLDGDTIIVGKGNHEGAYVTKAVEIKGKGRAVINAWPMIYGCTVGFLFPWSDLGVTNGVANGATIRHLSFDEELDFPIYSQDTDDVIVDHCTFTSPNQAITNWNGNGWDISHNVINGLVTNHGGGIGIFVGTRDDSEATANDNFVAHNTITGQVVVSDEEIAEYTEEGTGYAVPGICLYSDGRRDPVGGPITGNRILKNKVSLSSNNPDFHPAVGIELTDWALINDEFADPDLEDNKVGFNDVRGVSGENSVPICLIPAEVADYNSISRNLGDDIGNRGHGLHPKALFHKKRNRARPL